MSDREPMTYGDDFKYIPAMSLRSGQSMEVRPDVYCHTIQIANIGLFGSPDAADYVLIDAGMPKSADDVRAAVEKRFGANRPPHAIILTHGHFDHVGALVDLVEQWGSPVYAHEQELPFLTGQEAYPEPDPSVDGGLIAKMSKLFPREPVNLGSHISALPSDGTVPGMPGWRWIHTPGHSRGHVALFRDDDRTIIAGDAFVTVRQDALFKVLIQEPEVNGPPRYFTPDWDTARTSVQALAALRPDAALAGHGTPMFGRALQDGLDRLAHNFDSVAVPDHGRYVDNA